MTDLLTEEEIKATSLSWYNIDKYTLSSKLSYFFFAAKESCYLPFMVLYLVSIGLNPAEAGIINGVRLLGNIVGAPIWGMLADHKNAHRCVLTILCVMAILFVCSQPFISIIIAREDINTCPYRGNITDIKSHGSKLDSKPKLFYIMLLINIISSLFDGCIIGFIDSAVVQRNNLKPKSSGYGRQRWVGNIGFALANFISSLAVEYFPNVAVSCYSAIFVVYFIFMICLTISVQFLLRNLTFGIRKCNTSTNVHQILRKTLFQGYIAFFFLTVLIMGIEQGLLIGFTFLYLKEMNAPNILLGLTTAIGSLSGVPTFFYSTTLIEFFGGHLKTVALCCFTYFIRNIWYLFLTNSWMALLVEPLQGFSFSLFLATSILYVKKCSPPTIITSMYSIMNGLYFGLGFIISNIAGGYAYKAFGGRVLFATGSGIALFWSIIVVIFACLQDKKLVVKDNFQDKDGNKNSKTNLQLETE